MKRINRVFLLACIISFPAVICAQSSSEGIPIPNLSDQQTFPLLPSIQYSTVVYQGLDGFIYYKNDLTQDPKSISLGERPQLSPDKTKVIYLETINSKGTNEKTDLILYDLQTKAKKRISLRTGYRPEAVEYSSKYFVVRTRSDSRLSEPTNIQWDIYNNQGLYLTTIPSCTRLFWIDDENLLCQTFRILSNKAIQPRTMFGIAVFRIKDRKLKVILRAQRLKEYEIIRLKNDRFVYVEKSVRSCQDWDKIEPKRTFWDQSINKLFRRRTSLNLKGAYAHLDKYYTLNRTYDVDNSNYTLSYLSENPSSKDWLLFMVQTKVGTPKAEHFICIANVLDPIRTIRKIADGVYPQW